VTPLFFGGRLLAINKKNGGFRPIAIGFTLRRLASKCANSVGISRLKAYFYPQQLGIGTPGGCEAAIHAALRFLESLPVNIVLVKLDFSNAFNSIHRRDNAFFSARQNSRTVSLLLLCLQSSNIVLVKLASISPM